MLVHVSKAVNNYDAAFKRVSHITVDHPATKVVVTRHNLSLQRNKNNLSTSLRYDFMTADSGNPPWD